MWGCVIYAIVLPVFQQVKDCQSAMCQYGYLEDSKLALKQMGENPILIVQSIGIILSISCFNATGVAITKYASAAQRSTVDTCRTLLIWLISLALKQETFDIPLSFGQVAGFAGLVIGTLIYNEIWVLPCELFSKNTKAKIEGRKLEGLLDDQASPTGGYMASSPAALYDSKRNERNIQSKLGQSDRMKILQAHDENLEIQVTDEKTSRGSRYQ